MLFRVFDIWKPFPVRQAESLPGGWGIMADDWLAGIYAALILWGVHAIGF
ncbi:MAG: phosphatidylglycerophosphatase A [Candidatus Acidiferrales bacterium]